MLALAQYLSGRWKIGILFLDVTKASALEFVVFC